MVTPTVKGCAEKLRPFLSMVTVKSPPPTLNVNLSLTSYCTSNGANDHAIERIV